MSMVHLFQKKILTKKIVGEHIETYHIIDTDEEFAEYFGKIKVEFILRSCRCMAPGCVDDTIKVYDDGDDEHPYSLDIPRDMTPYIKGLFDGEYKLVKKSEKDNG